jgi:pimeloyl-ACP methyl ester carboxylesterase
VNYEVKGQGDTVLLLHGWASSLQPYRALMDQLSGKYRVIAVDFPGMGQSEEPKEPWDVDGFADFTLAFLEQFDVKKISLVGHSYGGRVIIKLANRKLPFAIDKIVLIDSAGVMPERSAWQNFKVKRYKAMRNLLMSRPVHSLFPEVIDYWMSKQGSEDYRNASPVMKRCLVMAVNEDFQDRMPLVKQETLLVWGDLDLDTPISDARIMEEKMPNAALVVLEGTDHFSFLYRPAEFRRILRAFLIGGAA